MATAYNVYGNDLAGGPVDYSAPIATVSGPPWVGSPLPFDSDATYAVRAVDTATGLEERNVEARFRVLTGPAGEDLTGLPAPPAGVTAAAAAAGGARVRWS